MSVNYGTHETYNPSHEIRRIFFRDYESGDWHEHTYYNYTELLSIVDHFGPRTENVNFSFEDELYFDFNVNLNTNLKICSGTKIGVRTSLGDWTQSDNYNYNSGDKYERRLHRKPVIIGCDCTIGNNVSIHNGVIIGDNVRIQDNQIIGKCSKIDSDVELINSHYTEFYGAEFTYVGNGKICFNSITYPINFWLDNLEVLINLIKIRLLIPKNKLLNTVELVRGFILDIKHKEIESI